MKRTIQVRISKVELLFVAECLDLPVVTQAATLYDLGVNIRGAIGLHLEGEDLDALGITEGAKILATMEIKCANDEVNRGPHRKCRNRRSHCVELKGGATGASESDINRTEPFSRRRRAHAR